jgi:glutathione S-transferase
MAPRLELFILPGALYTRRVLIYLFEKGLITSGSKRKELMSKSMNMKITKVKSTLSGKMIADGKPEGSVPLLVIRHGDGEGEDKVVIGSLEIIEYFENLYNHADSSGPSQDRDTGLTFSNEGLKASMSGQTPDQKAEIKEMNILLEEATTSFENAARKGSAMFVFLEKRDREASRAALKRCREVLGVVNEYYVNNPHSTSPSSPPKGEVNISDILLFALLQFAHIMYDIQLWSGLDGLESFYRWFEEGESVLVEGAEEEVWDRNLRLVASCWVGEGGAFWEWGRVVGVLLRAVGGVVWGLVL